jgi:hypothetical protein
MAACLVLFLFLQVAEIADGAPLPVFTPQQESSAPGQDSMQPAAAQAQSGTGQSQSGQTKPVGTAAAPAEPVTGIAAARPAGAAIAPAKQRRARTILIRVSIVVGAAVAVGTVVALSHASPSRPN